MIRIALLLLSACGSTTTAKAPLANAGEPSWPVGDTVNLTWALWPATVPHPKWPDTVMAPVDLEISIGNVTRRVKLEPQQGSLFPHNQPVCGTTAYPLDPGEVGKLTFYEAGAGGHFVRRTQADRLEIGTWSLSDGGCPGPAGELTSCPRGETMVATIQIPAHVQVREAIVQVDASGGRTAFECPPPSP
jgi:hypothetical protein